MSPYRNVDIFSRLGSPKPVVCGLTFRIVDLDGHNRKKFLKNRTFVLSTRFAIDSLKIEIVAVCHKNAFESTSVPT